MTLFLAAEQATLPRQMFAGIRENISPAIAVATILIVLSTLMLITLEGLRRRNRRIRGVSADPNNSQDTES